MKEYTIRIRQGRISGMVPGLLSGHHTGRIHSSFRSSLNLQFGENLIHVGTEEHGLCCFGVTVGDSDMRLLLEACQVDNLAVMKKNGLYLYGSDRVIILELSEFAQVDLRIPEVLQLAGQYKRAPRRGKIPCLPLYQELQIRADGLELGLERDEEFQRCSDILSGSSGWERTDMTAAVQFFHGRGGGLTPAGDDILTGYGAVLQAFGQAEPFIEILQDISSKTTDVSRAYLSAMMLGYANEIFCDIILQIFCEEVLKLRELLCRIEKIGNTSGRDTIYGMYLGFRKIKEAYIV